MAERHAFTTGAHANRICAEHCIHFDFVGRLVRRTGDLQINAVCELDAQIVRRLMKECLQFFVIDCADIRKTHAQLAVVGSDEWRGDEGSVLIRNAHQCTRMETGVESARRVGQDDCLHAHERHDADRQDNLLHRITFVIVHASVHEDNRHLIDVSKYILALVPLHSGLRESIEFRIGNPCHHFDVVGESAQTGSEHNSNSRLEICARTHRL